MSHKYNLFSNTQTCAPCRILQAQLDEKFPEWRNYIHYVDINNMTGDDINLIVKLNVRSLPSFTSREEIISVGFSPDKLNKIIELCTLESKS